MSIRLFGRDYSRRRLNLGLVPIYTGFVELRFTDEGNVVRLIVPPSFAAQLAEQQSHEGQH